MRERVLLTGNWQNFVHEPARGALAKHLSLYAREQRWYRSKSVQLKNAAIEQAFVFGEGSCRDHCLILLGVELEGGARESYVLPLRFVAASVAAPDVASLVAEVEIQDSDGARATNGALLDASASRVFAEMLLGLLREHRILSGETAVVSGELWLGAEAAETKLEPRFLALEQSNSTILYGSSWLLKLLRKLEPGPNVELEIGYFLAEASPRAPVPRPVGSLQLTTEAGTCTLAVISEYVENRGSAWSLTLECLFSFFDRVLAHEGSSSAVTLPSAPVAECAEAIPEALLRLAEPYFDLVRRLAERTAELHRALGRSTREPGFGQEPFTSLHLNVLSERARAQLTRGFEALRQQRRRLPANIALLAERALSAEATFDQQLSRITHCQVSVTQIRCHGDYHLGQLLFTGDDFAIIDFDGEPSRSLAERRDKRSPLRDVAGMMRSFAYAAESALRSERVRAEDRARLVPWAEAFRAWVCVSFVRSYLAGVVGEAYRPSSSAQTSLLLEFYELEKALYELDYELNNRPDWLAVPLAGLARMAQVSRA